MPHIRRHRSIVALVVVAAAVAGGCRADAEPVAETGCAAIVRQASQAVEVDEQIALLDQALARCSSVSTLAGEMGKYPGIVGYSALTFVELRCTKAPNETVRESAVCSTYTALPTTTAPVAVAAPYIAETLDGRRIEIPRDGSTVFVGEAPEPMQRIVDIAIESGCPGVIAERDRLAAEIGSAAKPDEASAYTKHAENVADYIGCVYTPLAVPAG